MKEPEEVVYYKLPPFYAERIILPLYKIVEEIAVTLPSFMLNPEFAEMHTSVKERMMAADQEMPFIMNYHDCMVVCEMMIMIKFYYYQVEVPCTEGRDDLREDEKKSLEMFEICMKHIKDIGDDIVAVFPVLTKPFFQDETKIKKEKDEAKTLGLDKTTMAIQFSLADKAWSSYIIGLFTCFNYFIMQGESDFSARVRAAPFCCVTEVREVREIFNNALAETNLDEDYIASFSLRDVVVLLMMNNISQKAFFSDGGDKMHDFYDKVTNDAIGDKSVNMRDYMLMYAKVLQEIVCHLAKNTEGFEEAMKPILAFAV